MSRLEILTALAKGEIKAEDANDLLAALDSDEVTVKVSKQKAVQIGGLRGFPVTLYKDEALKLFGAAEMILAFIKRNDDKLLTKAQAKANKAALKELEGEAA